MQNGKQSRSSYRGVLYIIALVAAYSIGAYNSGNVLGVSVSGGASFHKFREVLATVLDSYVDEPDLEELEVGAIEGMLRALDPHSIYIPPREQSRIAEQFDGEFSGIGIQFDLMDDGILVVSPIPGTPADRMGLRAGDKIIEIDGISTLGITNDDVFTQLRGETGSSVVITVRRQGEQEPFQLTLTRGRIPIHSVEAAFLLSDNRTGYILINQFTSVTAREVEQSLQELERSGMEQLVLDLRGNSGGYLRQADEVVDRFITSGKVIVQTEGRARGNTEIRRSSDVLTHPDLPLVVLVNTGSASASEIVAGAIQDHDRGLIIGEPTFGKGLVQQPIGLDDGSVVRITTSRWFTPSGRCVQRPYEDGIGEYYLETMHLDSLEEGLDTAQVFYTRTGREMYAWRGIRPDVFVRPGYLSEYGTRIVRERLLIDWAREYAEQYESFTLPFDEFRDDWTIPREDVEEFLRYADEQGIDFDRQGWNQDRDFLLLQIKAELAQRFYNGRTYFWQILVSGDELIDTALVHIGEADQLARTPSQ